MVINSNSVNILIKRKKLINILKKNGIPRVNREAVKEIELIIEKEINSLSKRLNQFLLIKGKKTLEKKDVLSLNKEKNYLEI